MAQPVRQQTPQARPPQVAQAAPAAPTAPTEITKATTSSRESSAVVNTKTLKVNTPDKFYREQGKLDEFLLQCELYVRFNIN